MMKPHLAARVFPRSAISTSPIATLRIDPIVMGRKFASVSASNESGTAVKMIEMTMSTIGT